ncbi:DNA-binding protein [Erysipelothrix sp. D19-032]
MKEHVIKLMPGEDIIVALDQYCKKYEIKAKIHWNCRRKS